jgi:hypothetical protein
LEVTLEGQMDIRLEGCYALHRRGAGEHLESQPSSRW